MGKPIVSWGEFFWETLRAEHARNRCAECRNGGCIANQKPCPNCGATLDACNERLMDHPKRCCGPCKRHETSH